jgi:hypothetical protein
VVGIVTVQFAPCLPSKSEAHGGFFDLSYAIWSILTHTFPVSPLNDAQLGVQRAI